MTYRKFRRIQYLLQIYANILIPNIVNQSALSQVLICTQVQIFKDLSLFKIALIKETVHSDVNLVF